MVDMNFSDKEKSKFQIFTKTWVRDSHGLFDYESPTINSNIFNPISNGFLYRVDNKVIFTNELKQNSSEGQQPLASLTINPKNDQDIILSTKILKNLPVNNQTLTDLQEQIWYVVESNSLTANIKPNRFYSNFTYELKKNDIIKLGRIKYLVKEINIVGKEVQQTEETFLPYEPTTIESQKPEDEVCRICYNPGGDNSNPLISICKCKGSMKLHLNCLRMYLKSKLSIKEIANKPGVSYIVKQFNCEICFEPYPVSVKNQDTLFHLIDYEIPVGQNYVVLQSLNSIKENSLPLAIHVLMFIDEGESFTLGRGHESDIKICDISVSRLHARIFMKEGKFLMEDMCSKFGTLVLSKEPVPLTPNTLLQIGRTLVFYGEDNSKKIYNKAQKEKEKLDDDKIELEPNDNMKIDEEGDNNGNGECDNNELGDEIQNLHI